MFAALGLGEVLARLIAFAGTVYVARRLGADVYGVIAVAAAIVLYFSYIADFAVELVGTREVAQQPGVVEGLAPPLVAARLGFAAACIVALGAAGFLFFPQPDGAILASTSLSLLAVAGSTRFVFLGLERPAAVALVRVGGEIVALGLLVLLARDAGDLGNVPLARFVGDGSAALLLVLLLRRRGFRLAVRRAPELVRPLFVKAAPLVLHSILGLVIFNSDLIFLRAMAGTRTAGTYAAAYALVSFLLNLGVTYGNSLLPVFTRLGNDPERQRALYDSSMAQAFTVALPIAVGGCLVASGLMGTVFGAKYAASVAPLQILIWSVVAAWVRTVVTFALIALHHQSFVLRITAWSAAANVVLNVALIPRYGMSGAATATLVTEAVRTVVALIYAGRLGLPFGLAARAWRPAVATAAMALALWRVPTRSAVLAVALGAVVFAAALTATGGIRLVDGRPVLTV